MKKGQITVWLNLANWPLRVKLVLSIILLIGLTLASVSWLTIQREQARISRQIGTEFVAEAEGLRNLAAVYLQGRVNHLQVLALSDVLKATLAEHNAAYQGSEADILSQLEALDATWQTAADDDPLVRQVMAVTEELNPATYQLRDLSENIEQHADLFITDRYGALVGATVRPADYYHADEAWWQAAWNGGRGAVYISNPVFNDHSGVTGLQIAVPIYDEAGQSVNGILRSTMVVEELFSLIEAAGLGQTGHSDLIGASGRTLIGREGSESLPVGRAWVYVQRIADSPAPAGFDLVVGPVGDEWLFGYARLDQTAFAFQEDKTVLERQAARAIDDLEWVLIFEQTAAEAFAELDQFVWQTTLIGSLALLVAAGLAFLLAGTITRPLVRLGQAAQQIGLGRLDTPLPPAGQDEVGRLSDSFGQMAAQLSDLVGSLEDEVAHRTERLLIVAELGEQLGAILELTPLLETLVNQIKDRFGYYHAQVYLLDADRERLVMTEGVGEAGAAMKRQGHAIPFESPTSLVARAAQTKNIVAIDDVRQSPDWLPNKLLPDTHSEMAIPIILSGDIVGVLDVQHDQIAGLGSSDEILLRSVASQVAVAIRNARLFERVEISLTEAQAIQARYIEQGWDQNVVKQKYLGQGRFSATEAALAEAVVVEARQQAVVHRAPTVTVLGEERKPGVVAPILLQNRTIGNLQLHGASRNLNEAELSLIDAVLDQVAQSAENLRLFDETRDQAARQRTIREITDKLRSAPNLERLIEVAATEISQYLSAEYAELELGFKPAPAERSVQLEPGEQNGHNGQVKRQ